MKIVVLINQNLNRSNFERFNLKSNKHLETTVDNENENENINLNLLNQLPLDKSIMEGSIGKLAMDIAKDIDISKLELPLTASLSMSNRH